MNNSDYKKVILTGLLKKYNNRCAKNIITNRRIILKPTEVYKDYARNNADISEKQKIQEAALELNEMGFVSVDHLKFSDDIEKIYFLEERIDALYEYMQEEYGIVPQNTVSKQVHKIVERYKGAGEIVQKYCKSVLAQMKDPGNVIVPERIDKNLKMLSFLENNRENIYVREASMLVYGDSKWFEKNNCEEICLFIRTETGRIREESERNDSILNVFHVTPTEQEIFIKGKWKIEWEQYELDISKIQGGIAIASGDVRNIKSIRVDSECVMTIENKTSFQRLRDGKAATIYLGGFANRYQIEFLKRVISNNPDITYRHFGDIDVGGFLIHKHLCRETCKNFELYCMGIEQLQDARYSHCLKELTDNDRSRIGLLMEEETYSEVLKYMNKHNVKLEQEIVSYYLDKEKTDILE